MKHSTIPLAQTLVQLCKAKNIKHIVISPGSRNAPLTIGFTHNPFFTCYSIVDERSAAFFALGIAQQTQSPVAVVCTSGSALLNYYPAVAEAFYSDVPLVVISADRPEFLIDIGDGQTIRQPNALASHVLCSVSAKLDVQPNLDTLLSEVYLKNKALNQEELSTLQYQIQQYNEQEITKALDICILENGPVHINAPFHEPLYQTQEQTTVKISESIPAQKLTAEIDLTSFVKRWNSATKKMILVGALPPNQINKSVLNELAKDQSVVVFTETTSNLYHDAFFESIDKIIAPIEKSEDADAQFKMLQPELLITFGGMVVSKKIKAFLRKYKPKEHWHINPKKAYNTYFSLTEHVKKAPQDFFTELLPKTKKQSSDYKTYWQSVKKHRAHRHESYLQKIPFSDLKAFSILLNSIPDNYNVHLSNSSTIRYAQLFTLNPTLKVFCNRGTSGIDGSSSTAVGYAKLDKDPTLLITGDLSFFYDSNAFWNTYLREDFRIIVINNSGGGIFRILPGNKNTPEFDTFFETKHNYSSKAMCQHYGFSYLKAENEDELQKAIADFYNKSNKPKLLEIFTPRTLNDEILLNYFTYLR